MTDLHKLLQRQIKRTKSVVELNDENTTFFSAVSDTYVQYEQEIGMLERSLFLTSAELNERNTLLKVTAFRTYRNEKSITRITAYSKGNL